MSASSSTSPSSVRHSNCKSCNQPKYNNEHMSFHESTRSPPTSERAEYRSRRQYEETHRPHKHNRDTSFSDEDPEDRSRRSYRESRHKRADDYEKDQKMSRRHRSRSRSPGHRHRDSRKRSRDHECSSHHKHRRSRRSRSRLSTSKSTSRSSSHSTSPRRKERPRERPRNHHKSAPPPTPPIRSNRALPSQAQSYKGTNDQVAKPAEKEKPNFNTTGLLARESNTVAGTNIVLKYNEPPDARKPPSAHDWRLYIFKNSSVLQTVSLRTRTCWLIGREHAVADIPVDHPSCSSQHAVIQFRHRTTVSEFGDRESKVKPYIIDLESSNGTLLNGDKIVASRYVEIQNGDVLKFGYSEREYVVVLPPKDT